MKFVKGLFDNAALALASIIKTIAAILMIIVAVVGVIASLVLLFRGSFGGFLGGLIGTCVLLFFTWFGFLMTIAMLDAMVDVKAIRKSLEGGAAPAGPAPTYDVPPVVPAYTAPQEAAKWVCPVCGTENDGQFCIGCGAKKA